MIPSDPPAATTDVLDGVGRIWLGPESPGPQTRIFRREVRTAEIPVEVRLHLFAESRFHLWVNGQYVQRGPCFHHPHRRPVARLDLLPFWLAGDNVIAVLVHVRNLATHNSVPSGEPGLTAKLTLRTADESERTVTTDGDWRALAQSPWLSDAPRRNWGLGHVEVFDAGAAPARWKERDYDDSAWPCAELCQPTTSIANLIWLEAPLPNLRASWAPAVEALSLEQAPAKPYELSASDSTTAFGEHLTDRPWAPAEDIRLVGTLDAEGGGLRVEGLTPDRAVAIWTDLGRQNVGQILLDCRCETPGTIDVGWSERMLDGRPAPLLKGTTYADRILAPAGDVEWEQLNFSGARYVGLFLQGFTGAVTLRRLGMRATEPDMEWIGRFECEDDRLNEIWRLCARTLQIGTQEGLMDCPSREQAPYLGDGHPVARWIGLLTGDYRHWKHLITESFARQGEQGFVHSTPFTGARNILLDYLLLGVIATRDYLLRTGDRATVEAVLPHCRKVLEWFSRQRDERGLLALGMNHSPQDPPWEHRYEGGDRFATGDTLIFIDHPGLGWHNQEDPGIDRRGMNTGINALYVVALQALADIEEALATGKADALRGWANQTAEATSVFFNRGESAFTDGLRDETPLAQISQQTNVWCLWADLLDGEDARRTLKRILRDDDAQLARCGPYFWCYFLPILARYGMHKTALGHIRRLWGRMIDGGATTLWETFSGDHLDTWCHPWAGAPVEFLLTEILGLDTLRLGASDGVLQPRTDLLARAAGTVALPAGPASIRWEHGDDGCVSLSGHLPDGVETNLLSPAGQHLAAVRGDWSLSP